MDEKKLEMILLLISMSLDAVYQVVNAFRQSQQELSVDDLAAMIAKAKDRTAALMKDIENVVKLKDRLAGAAAVLYMAAVAWWRRSRDYGRIHRD